MTISKQKFTMAIAALMLGSGAWAGDDSFFTESRSEPVRYARSDLATEQGAADLYARLEAAARRVCGQKSRMLAQQVQWQQCHDEALDEAVTAVNDTRLSALHKGAPRRLIASGSAEAANPGS